MILFAACLTSKILDRRGESKKFQESSRNFLKERVENKTIQKLPTEVQKTHKEPEDKIILRDKTVENIKELKG